MLKKTLLTAAVLGLATTTAQASELFGQEVSGYVTGSIGQAKAERPKPVKSLQNIWEGWGANTSNDRNDTAYKIAVGLKVNPYVAVEAQYIDLGKATYKSRDSGSSWSHSFKTDFKTSGLGANLVGTLPLDDFTLFAKVGYHYLNTKRSFKYNYTSGSDSESKTIRKWAPSFGVGATYAITQELSFVAEYERYHKVANKTVDIYGYKSNFKHNIDFASIGLRYNF